MIHWFPLGIDLSKITESHILLAATTSRATNNLFQFKFSIKQAQSCPPLQLSYSRLKMKLISCLISGIFFGISCDLLGWNRTRNFVHAIELSGRKFEPAGYQKRLQRHQLEAIVRFYQRHNPNALKEFITKLRSSVKY